MGLVAGQDIGNLSHQVYLEGMDDLVVLLDLLVVHCFELVYAIEEVFV